jgi:hypothetical protein
MTNTNAKTRECEVLVIGSGVGRTAVASRPLPQRQDTEAFMRDPLTDRDHQPGCSPVASGKRDVLAGLHPELGQQAWN